MNREQDAIDRLRWAVGEVADRLPPPRLPGARRPLRLARPLVAFAAVVIVAGIAWWRLTAVAPAAVTVSELRIRGQAVAARIVVADGTILVMPSERPSNRAEAAQGGKP
jgi:hypothetical protein